MKHTVLIEKFFHEFQQIFQKCIFEVIFLKIRRMNYSVSLDADFLAEANCMHVFDEIIC